MIDDPVSSYLRHGVRHHYGTCLNMAVRAYGGRVTHR